METTPYGKKTLGQSCVTIAGVNCKKKTGGFGAPVFQIIVLSGSGL